MRAGRLDAAENLLAGLGNRKGGTIAERIMHAQVLFRLGRRDDALAIAQASFAAAPENIQIRLQIVDTLERLRDFDGAQDILARTRRDFPDDSRILTRRAQLWLHAGKLAKARKTIARALTLEPDNAEYRLWEIVILAVAGERDQARTALRSMPDHEADILSIFEGLASFARNGDQAGEAVALAETALDLVPGSAATICLAECLHSAGRVHDALAVLGRITHEQMDQSSEIFLRTARIRVACMTSLGNDKGFGEALALALTMKAGDAEALTGLCADRELGRHVPDRLAAALNELRTCKPDKGKWSNALQWAWEFADQERWDRDSWHAAEYWGRNAARLLRAWLLDTNAARDELDALIVRPDPSAMTMLLEPRKCVVVGSHLGPVAAGAHFMQNCGRPFCGFGGGGADPALGDGWVGPQPRDASQTSALKNLIAEIKKGTLAGFAQDARPWDKGLAMTFLGRRIHAATLVPRLAWSQRASTVWVQPLWRDGRIVIEIEPLPDLDGDASLEVWCRRWCTAYLEKVERIVRGAPENLTTNVGIWKNAKEHSKGHGMPLSM